MAALLTSDFQNLDRVSIEISECEKMNVKVLPPNVNKSFVEFGVDKESGNITFALSAIKNVGLGVAEKIVEERKNNGDYKSFEEFISRLGPEVTNKKSLESLARAGALDEFNERNQLLVNMDLILKFAGNIHKATANGQMGLFVDTKNKSTTSLKLLDSEPASKNQRLAWEKELLGIYLSEHPLNEYKDILFKVAEPINLINSKKEGTRVKIAGIITSVQKIITKSKEPMIFARLEDTTNTIEVLVFPKMLQKNPLIWQPENIVVIEGKMNLKDGTPKILADKIEELGKQASINGKNGNSIQELHITLTSTINKETLNLVKDVLMKSPGKSEVVLKIPNNGITKELKLKTKVEIGRNLLNNLSVVIDQNNIRIV